MFTRFRFVLAALAALLILAGCSGGDGQVTSSGTQGYVGAQKSLTQVPPAAREKAPIASGPQLGTDRTVSTADYLGQVVVVNVWGSWCNECRAEAADLQQASAETAKKAQFVGINSKDFSEAPAEAFNRAFKVTYPSIYDPDGQVLLTYYGNLPLSAFPSTLVIDKQGRIAARIVGPITKTSLVDIIDDVASGK